VSLLSSLKNFLSGKPSSKSRQGTSGDRVRENIVQSQRLDKLEENVRKFLKDEDLNLRTIDPELKELITEDLVLSLKVPYQNVKDMLDKIESEM